MATVKIELRRDKLNKQNESPLYFRVIKFRKSSRIPSGIYVPIDLWDDKNKKVKKGYPNSARVNAFIAKKMSELQETILDSESNIKTVTTKKLKEAILGKSPKDFFVFAQDEVNKFYSNGQIGTYRAQMSALSKVKEFVEYRDITFNEMDLDFLNKYENYMRTRQKLKTNTIHRHMKFLRKIFNEALRMDVISYDQNPFTKYKLKQEKTSRDFLSEDELEIIENLSINKTTKMNLHRWMFIFASYVGGVRISDVLKLRLSQYDGVHIHLTIHKTKNQLSIKIPNKAKEIIEMYISKDSKPSDFIFPCLPAEIDLNNPEELHTAISRCSAYINKNLKFIAEKAGIDKKLSFHISRHTWATRALRKGISIDKVSKLMGHAQLRETQIYAKIVNEELDKAMDVFND
jgi:site-specific recombinase XerD